MKTYKAYNLASDKELEEKHQQQCGMNVVVSNIIYFNI